MREAHHVLHPGRFFRLDARVDPDVPMQGPLDVAIEDRSEPAPRPPHQPAILGDGVGIEEAFEVLGLEVQILMPRVRQRVFAVYGVEHSHGGCSLTPSWARGSMDIRAPTSL